MTDEHGCDPPCQHDVIVKALANPRIQARLRGERHRHHPECIHNLTPDEQITLRGQTREWWERMGLPEPIQITPAEWEDL